MSEEEFEATFHKTINFLEERYARRIEYFGPELISTYLMKVYQLIAASIDVFDGEILIAALLHRIINETNSTIDEINKHFGATISDLVHELTPTRSYHQYHFYYPNLKSRKAILIYIASLMVRISHIQNHQIANRFIRENVFWRTAEGSDNNYL